jgi:hypothetical protein
MSPDRHARAMRDPVQAAAYEQHLASAYRNLEYLINELGPAAFCLENIVENNLKVSSGAFAPKQIAGHAVILMNEDQSAGLFFAMYQLGTMARKLAEQYHSGFDLAGSEVEQGERAAA